MKSIFLGKKNLSEIYSIYSQPHQIRTFNFKQKLFSKSQTVKECISKKKKMKVELLSLYRGFKRQKVVKWKTDKILHVSQTHTT